MESQETLKEVLKAVKTYSNTEEVLDKQSKKSADTIKVKQADYQKQVALENAVKCFTPKNSPFEAWGVIPEDKEVAVVKLAELFYNFLNK